MTTARKPSTGTFPLRLDSVVKQQAAPTKTSALPSRNAAVTKTPAATPASKVPPQRNAVGSHSPAQQAALRTAPVVPTASGLGLASERAKQTMVQRLRDGGLRDERVIRAMLTVPRHQFMDQGLASQAYEDAALPIGHQQTISKPSVVSRMIELLCHGRANEVPLQKVLEIGTGCGYQAAVLSLVAQEVYSIERIKPLFEKAKTNLRPLRVPNIRLHYGDGMLGLPQVAPFDAIILAAAGMEVPAALYEQLSIGGRLIAPVASSNGQTQQLHLVERVAAKQFKQTVLEGVFFVPLKSGIV